MRMLYNQWILFIVSGLLFLAQCSSPTKSETSTKVTIQDVWFSDPVDNDGDGYVSYARLNFDLDTNKDNVDVTVKLGVRYYDPQDTATYIIYFESTSITVEGSNNTSDARYIEIGGSYVNFELPSGFFDFLLHVFPASNPEANPVAEASWKDFEVLQGFGFEPESEDQLPIMSLSSSSLNFGSGNTQASFEIENVGGSILDWEITSNHDWLSVSDNYGTTQEETDVIYVYVDRTGLSAGIYFGVLTVEPNFGATQTVSVQMEVAASAFQFTVTNEVFTDIYIDVSGQDSRTITPGGSQTWNYATNPGSVTIAGETYGEPNPGVYAGLQIVWPFTYSTTGLTTLTRNLIITNTFVFIYLQNEGVHDLHHLYVNADDATYETYDNIYIENDGVTRGIGYYYANTGMLVRAWWYLLTTYVTWTEGSQFNLPNTDNQSVFLWNNTKMIPEENPAGIFSVGGGSKLPAPISSSGYSTENLAIGRAWQPGDRVRQRLVSAPEISLEEAAPEMPEKFDLGYSGTSGPRMTRKLIPQESSPEQGKLSIGNKTARMKR